MTRDDALRFEELLNHWASVDVQLERMRDSKNPETEHALMGFLLTRRKQLIDAVKVSAEQH